MEEFTEQTRTLDSSPKAFETFIWGCWRRRISELFIVDADVINGIETRVMPMRLRDFLGNSFDLLRLDGHEIDERDDPALVEEITVSRHCRFCSDEGE